MWWNKKFTKPNGAKVSGYFDQNNQNFVSFFVQDYLEALKSKSHFMGISIHFYEI